MLTQEQARETIGATLYAADGDKIGRIGQVFLDDETGAPEFATVNTGLFGTSESFVPLSEADVAQDRVTVPFSKDVVKDAPNVPADGAHIDQSEERRIYEHYGLGYSERNSDSGLPATESADAGTTDVAAGHDTSGPNTDDAMTRSEERVQVGTTDQEAGRARLRKYVVTEEETHTVPVRKERAVLESEPITDANAGAATDGPAISEEEHEVTLHEERPVVQKTTEPVERVRLGTEETTSEETVSEEVRKEQVEAEGDIDRRA